RHRVPPPQAGARLRARHRHLGRRSPRLRGSCAGCDARARLPRRFLPRRAGPASAGDAGWGRDTLLQAHGRVRVAARLGAGDRSGRGALLLLDAAGGLAVRVRRRSREEPEGREPCVLRANGSRADERHLQGGRARSGVRHAGRGGLERADATRGDRPDEGARGVPRRGGAGGGDARAAPRHGLSRGARSDRARMVSQVPRAGRARGAGAPGPRGGGATGAGERAAPARHHGAGADVGVGRLVVGSIALDSVATPFGETAGAPGGSAVFFSAAGVILHPVQVVGVIGTDYPPGALRALEARGVDLSGVERAQGESFRWKAKYSYDLSSRETLETRLGVFAEFRPKLPAKFRDARYVFLGNIDPELQLGVLDQVKHPELVACDTMNYWIHSKRDLLLELLRHIDILMVNDSEARELSGDWNIYRAARWILARGPRLTVVKQGEHGALLVSAEATFKVPAYPLQEVFDPTGAGDAFAGGFMGYLASTGDVSDASLRRAMVYGA